MVRDREIWALERPGKLVRRRIYGKSCCAIAESIEMASSDELLEMRNLPDKILDRGGRLRGRGCWAVIGRD